MCKFPFQNSTPNPPAAERSEAQWHPDMAIRPPGKPLQPPCGKAEAKARA